MLSSILKILGVKPKKMDVVEYTSIEVSPVFSAFLQNLQELGQQGFYLVDTYHNRDGEWAILERVVSQ